MALGDCTIIANNSFFVDGANGTGKEFQFGSAFSLYRVTGTFNHCAFVNNTAYRNDSGYLGGNGGALDIFNSSIDFVDTLFEYNSAASGGAIFAINSKVNITDCDMTRNYARTVEYPPKVIWGGNGGAIYAVDSDVQIQDSNFYRNVAMGTGGALYNDASNGRAIVIAKGCHFYKNRGRLGPIWNNGTLILNDTQIDDLTIDNTVQPDNIADLVLAQESALVIDLTTI
jgi:hypothetical protein